VAGDREKIRVRVHLVTCHVTCHHFSGSPFYFFALGLMAKPMLVTCRLFMLLLDYWPLERISNFKLEISKNWPRLALEKMAVLPARHFSSASRCWRNQRTCMTTRRSCRWRRCRGISRLGTFAAGLRWLSEKCFWPAKLAVFYPRPTLLLIPRVAGDA